MVPFHFTRFIFLFFGKSKVDIHQFMKPPKRTTPLQKLFLSIVFFFGKLSVRNTEKLISAGELAAALAQLVEKVWL